MPLILSPDSTLDTPLIGQYSRALYTSHRNTTYASSTLGEWRIGPQLYRIRLACPWVPCRRSITPRLPVLPSRPSPSSCLLPAAPSRQPPARHRHRLLPHRWSTNRCLLTLPTRTSGRASLAGRDWSTANVSARGGLRGEQCERGRCPTVSETSSTRRRVNIPSRVIWTFEENERTTEKSKWTEYIAI